MYEDGLMDWLDEHLQEHPEAKVTGLLLRGREYPVRAPKIERHTIDADDHVWVMEKDGTTLVLKSGAVAGIELANAENGEPS